VLCEIIYLLAVTLPVRNHQNYHHMNQESIDADNDVPITPDEIARQQLNKLYTKREELLALLGAIEENLYDSGYLKDDEHKLRNSGLLQTGIRINGQLSFRGEQKASEFFTSILDSDHDGLISFEDFRGQFRKTMYTYSFLGYIEILFLPIFVELSAMHSLSSPYFGLVHLPEFQHW